MVFPYLVGCPFNSQIFPPFAVHRLFGLIQSHLLQLLLPVFLHLTQETIANTNVKGLFSVFSSSIFVVSGLIFMSLIHFKFIFVEGVRQWSSLTLFHVAVQFSQHHLLKRLCFPYCVILVKNQLTTYMWIYFWALYFVPLIYLSGFMPLPCCFDYYSCIV